MFTQPVFKHDKERFTPLSKTLKLNDGRIVTFCGEKTSGVAVGGWYKDAEGQKYLAKFYNNPSVCYIENLMTDIARIAIGKEFVPNHSIIYQSQDSNVTAILISEIEEFRHIGKIQTIKERQAMAADKFHPVFALNALLDNDDLNEGNLGFAGSNNDPKVIDFGIIPSFLCQRDGDDAIVPLHLASLIGHRGPVGMPLVRRSYFGQSDFLNPFMKGVQSYIEDISYYELLKSVEKITKNKDKILKLIAEQVKVVAARGGEVAEDYNNRMRQFSYIIQKRIEWMGQNFANDIVNKDAFKKLKWRNTPLFKKMMAQEHLIYTSCAKRNIDNCLNEICKKLDIQNINKLLTKTLTTAERLLISEVVNENNMLHNAITTDNVRLVEWVCNNSLADQSQTWRTREYNYQNLNLTPLAVAINSYFDASLYDKSSLQTKARIVEYVAAKLVEINSEKYDGDNYKNNKKLFAAQLTFAALKHYHIAKAEIENSAASVIGVAVKSRTKIDENAPTHQ